MSSIPLCLLCGKFFHAVCFYPHTKSLLELLCSVSVPLVSIILHLAVTSVCPYKELLSYARHQTHPKLFNTLLSQLNLSQRKNLRGGLTSDPLFNNRPVSFPFSRSGLLQKKRVKNRNLQCRVVSLVANNPLSRDFLLKSDFHCFSFKMTKTSLAINKLIPR